MTKAFIITRTDISPYQAENFVPLEKSMCESLGFHYDLSAKSPDIIFTNTLTDMGQISERLDLKRVQLIIHPNSGYDNYPQSFIENAHFPIILGNPIRANPVVEYSLYCLFDYFSKTSHSPKWDKSRAYPRELISNQNILIIGKGIIGSKMGEMLELLGAKVSFYDPFKIKSEPLDHLVLSSDVIILAASLNKSSYHLLNKSIFVKCKKRLLIINPARGSLINSKDLIEFLTSNDQSFAYLDVFESEPRNHPELEVLKNVKLTSHIAGVHNSLDHEIIKYESVVLSHFKSLNRLSFEQKYSDLNLKNRIIDGELI